MYNQPLGGRSVSDLVLNDPVINILWKQKLLNKKKMKNEVMLFYLV